MQYQQLDPSGGGLVVQELPQHLRRGVHLGPLLSRFGWLLRTRPDSLPVEAQERLHSLAAPVAGFFYFLSHCWHSPGHHKYAALLCHFMAPRAMLAGGLSALAIALLQRLWAPLPCYPAVDKASGLSLCMSPWEFLAGMVVYWVVLLLGPMCVRDRPAFFDATCIPQAPMEAKLEGIRHLPSFVAASSNFVIAWDLEYFTRAWCVYELAMYKGLFPARQVTVLPIKMYTVIFVCHACNAFAATGFLVLMPVCDGSALPSLLTACLSGTIAARAGEVLDRQRRECDMQLMAFDFRAAGVQIESDRVEMARSIEVFWRGGVDELNQAVRTEIRAEVLSTLAPCHAMLPYPVMLIAAYPFLALSASALYTYSGCPAPVQVNHAIVDVALPLLFVPCAFASAMLLGARFGVPDTSADAVPWRLCHVGTGLAAGAASLAYNLLIDALPNRIGIGGLHSVGRWCGPLLSLGLSLALAGYAGVLFCPRRSHVPRVSGRAAVARMLVRM